MGEWLCIHWKANAFSVGFKELSSDAEFLCFVYGRGIIGSVALTVSSLQTHKYKQT